MPRMVASHPSYVATIWTADMVADRMVEAFEVLRAMPAAGVGGSWPSVIHDFADKLNQEETRDRTKWAWSRSRPSPSPDAISRMNDALGWPVKYLQREEGASRCLLLWAVSRAYKRSIERKLRARRWSRSTFERKRRQACVVIASGLNRDRVVSR